MGARALCMLRDDPPTPIVSSECSVALYAHVKRIVEESRVLPRLAKTTIVMSIIYPAPTYSEPHRLFSPQCVHAKDRIRLQGSLSKYTE